MRQIALGVVCALAVVVGLSGLEFSSNAPRPTAVADNGDALREVTLHFDPHTLAEVGPTYADLLGALPALVQVHVIVQSPEHFAAFQTFVREHELGERHRYHPVIVDKAITTWSRDRYTLVNEGDKALLLVPPRPTSGNESRKNDWFAPFTLADSIEGLEVRTTDSLFEGGDLTVTSDHVFATALLRARNEGGDLFEKNALESWLASSTGKKPILLGQNVQDVPQHHIGMFITPLDARRILVGDPDLGLAAYDEHVAEAPPLPHEVDRREASLERFRRIASELEERGFEVIRIPLVPLTDELTYLTYNNALLERRDDGKLHAYVPQFGFEALDVLGRAAYENAGVVVHPIDVSRIYRYGGTVRCLINVVRRYPFSPEA